MTAPIPTRWMEFERLVSEYDDALARGETPAANGVETPDPQLAARLNEAQACLELLEFAWPRAKSTAQTPPSGDAPKPPLRSVDDFELVREIGRGGMGVVYEAWQISLRRRVAVKFLPAAATLDRRRLKRFKNEARAAAALDHPHIVKVFAVGGERETPYFAMQLIDGRSLAEEIDSLRAESGQPPLSEAGTRALLSQRDAQTNPQRERGIAEPPETAASYTDHPSLTRRVGVADAAHFRRAARFGVQVCDALDHAHSQGVIHRDIKPANLLIDKDDWLWVADFGLALTVAEPGMTATGNVLGTLRYASPEQVLGKAIVDERSDVHSLGISLYELIALAPMFPGQDREAVLHAVIHDARPSLRRVISNVPRDLETIVLKATAKDASERYATARELGDDLQRFLDDKPIAARRRTVAQFAARWTRRHTGAMWAALLIMVLATIASVAAAIAFEHERQRTRDLAEELGWQLYDSDVKLADEARWNGDARRASELLSRYVPAKGEAIDRRGFEWRFLNSLTSPAMREVKASPEALYCIAFSPDGATVVVAGKDAIVRAYDADSLRLKFALETKQVEVNHVVFSKDGQKLATSGDDGTMKIWDATTRRLEQTMNSRQGKVFEIAFAREGASLWTVDEGPAVVEWDLASGEALREFPALAPTASSLAVSMDEIYMAVGGSTNTFSHWKLHTHWGPYTLELRDLATTVAFSPNTRWLAAGDKSGQVRVYQTAKTEPVHVIDHPDSIHGLAFSPDSNWLAISDRGGTIGVYAIGLDSTNARGPAHELERYRRIVGENSLSKWIAHSGRAYDVAFSPRDSSIYSVGDDGYLRAWSPAAVRLIRRLTEEPSDSVVNVVATPKEGQFLAIVFKMHGKGCCLRSIDAASGALRSEELSPHFAFLTQSRDGSKYAIASMAGFELRTGGPNSPWVLWPELRGVGYGGIEFSPHGDLLAVSLEKQDANVYLLDVAKGATLATMPVITPKSVPAFSPDGKLLAIDSENTIEIWSVAERKRLFTLRGHGSSVADLEFSPDGKTLASVSDDRTLRLWDVARRSEKLSIVGHTAPVLSLAFTPDGASIATGDELGQIKVWSAKRGRELCTLVRWNSPIHKLVFSRQGRYLAWKDKDSAWVIDVGTLEDRAAETKAASFAPRDRSPSKAIGAVVTWTTATLFVFDPATNLVLAKLPVPSISNPVDVVVTPDRSKAFVSVPMEKNVYAFNLHTLQQIGEPIAVANHALGLACTADGRFVLVTGEQGHDQPLAVIDVKAMSARSFSHGSAHAVAASVDGVVIVADMNANLLRRATIDGRGEVTFSEQTLEFPGVWNVALAPDGRTGIAMAGNLLQSFDVATMKPLDSCALTLPTDGVFSPAGDRFYARAIIEMTAGRNVRVVAYGYDPKTGELSDNEIWVAGNYSFTARCDGVNQVSISPDGSLLYVSDTNGARIINSSDGVDAWKESAVRVPGECIGIHIVAGEQLPE